MSEQINESRLNIAVLSALDVQDRRSWSGTFYSMAQALQRHCGDVSFLGPLDAPREILLGKVLHTGSRLLFKKKVAFHHSHAVSQKYAQIVNQRLEHQRFDVIFSLSGATEIAFLETDIPIVLLEDATFSALHGYHPHFSNLHPKSIYQLYNMQARGIQKASLLIYSTQWAARSALTHYAADPQKVRVVPFGANMEHVPDRAMVLQRSLVDRPCRLLLVGVDWKYKGGDLALETLIALEKRGVPAELTVCGCTPPANVNHPKLTCIPFLDKNNPRQRQELEQLYVQSDLFFLPTRNECFGIVFCEANAFGLPVIATDTGGVAEVVLDGENGFTLPYDAGADAYADAIAAIVRNPPLYQELVHKSRARFEERLNWDAWGMDLKQALQDVVMPSVYQASQPFK